MMNNISEYLQYLNESKVIRYKGKTSKVDEVDVSDYYDDDNTTSNRKKIFLLNFEDYTPEWASWASQQLGIKRLTKDHFKAINVVRNYYEKKGMAPMIRIIIKLSGFDLKKLYLLFPEGPGVSLTIMSGLPYNSRGMV